MSKFWPDTLPRQPRMRELPQDNVLRSTPGAGPPDARRRSTAEFTHFEMAEYMTNAQVEILRDFRRNDLAGGALPFYYTLPRRVVKELLLNGGFETGSFVPGWNAGSASVVVTEAHAGTYGAELVATGADIDGAQSSVIYVDEAETYTADVYGKVTARTAGDFKVIVNYYDKADASLGSADLLALSAVGGWTRGLKTIGPAGPDLVFPAGTKSIEMLQAWRGGAPNGTGYIDDASFVGPRVAEFSFLGPEKISPISGDLYLVTFKVMAKA